MVNTASKNAGTSLVAGPLRAEFDPETGALDYVSFQGACIWRQLIVLVRDDQWQTVPAKVHVETLECRDDDFAITFSARHEVDGELRFTWTGTLIGTAQGVITYRFAGEAVAAFQANRIGFCLLHPAWVCAGQPIRQTRTDGSCVEGRFPELIEPQVVGRYSIQDLTRLAHQFVPARWAEAEFAGEVFETEDQRNWSDGSFKTYCTPLERPFPVTLNAGDRREQTVTLRLLPEATGNSPTKFRGDAAPTGELTCEVELARVADAGWEWRTAPELALTFVPSGGELSAEERQGLCRLGLAALRVDLPVASWRWHERYQAALREAGSANLRLEVVLQLPQARAVDLAAVADALSASSESIQRVLVYRKGEPCTRREDVETLRQRLPASIPLGGGSDANFCELNAENAVGNLPVSSLDFLCWSVTPQVHATDNRSLVETVQSLAAMVRTAQQFSAGRPLFVSPITLKPRFNAVGTNSDDEDDVPSAPADPRQQHPIVAAWMTAGWLTLGAAGVGSTTWFETHGPCGLCSDLRESSWGPVPRAFQLMGSITAISPLVVDRPELVAAVVKQDSEPYLLVVNLAPHPQQIFVNSIARQRDRGGCQSILDVPPYGVVLHPVLLNSGK